jgi:hypothetical protein
MALAVLCVLVVVVAGQGLEHLAHVAHGPDCLDEDVELGGVDE